MKILQVIPYFPPAWSFGGPPRCAFYISRELVRRGHDVTVYTTNALDQKRNINSRNRKSILDGVKVYYFRNVIRIDKLFISPGMIGVAKREIGNFDVVHLHEYRKFQNVIVNHYAKKYCVPYILQAHGSIPRTMAKRRLKWISDALFGYRLLRDASKVVALSQKEAEQYRGMGVPEEKIAVIPNGIDLSEYADLPPKGSFKKKFGINDDEKILLYLGRIHESKGLNLLAEAFSVVLKELEKVRLVIVGPDDGYGSAFSRLISDLGIEAKILLTSFVEKEDKLAALVDSNVFVTPRFHGFPVTFLEACLSGSPIVTATDELDWIHENVGYVVENSPIALAKAISNILQDEQMCKRFRNNCRHTIKNFDISAIAYQLEETYESLVSG